MKIISITPCKTTAAVKFDEYIGPHDFGCRLDKEGALILDLETVVAEGLSEGDEIDYSRLESIMLKSNQNRAFQAALRLISRGDHSVEGLKRKLAQKYGLAAAEYAVNRLKELKYLDDAAFAEKLAEYYLCHKAQSQMQAVYNMMQKGIDRKTAETAAAKFAPDPVEQIKRLIDTKYKFKLNSKENINKTKAALLRKGFDYADIRRAIAEYTKEEE